MFKYKIGKRDNIKFAQKVPEGEAGEMFALIKKMDKEAAIFIPFTKETKEELLNRYRGRINNWRTNGRIDDQIKLSITEDNEFVIYHALRKRGRPAENAEA